MSLWRLEWLRLVRTRRLVLLCGVFAFLGVLGPVSARYLGEVIDRFGRGVTVELPTPVPASGIEQFNLNAQQIGLVLAVLVASAALTIDAVPEMSVFLRTRVERPATLLWPRVVASFAAIGTAYLLGVAVAAYQTWALLGPVPAGPLLIGASLGVLYLAFAVAVTAVAASRTSSVLVTAGGTLAGLVAMPITAAVDPLGRWLPSRLVGGLDHLVRGGDAGDYWPSVGVTVVAILGLLALAARSLGHREL